MGYTNYQILTIGAQAEHDRELESLKEIVRDAYRGNPSAGTFANLLTQGPDEELLRLLAEYPEVIGLLRRLASYGWWTAALACMNEDGRATEADGTVIATVKEREDARQRENTDWSDDDREIE